MLCVNSEFTFKLNFLTRDQDHEDVDDDEEEDALFRVVANLKQAAEAKQIRPFSLQSFVGPLLSSVNGRFRV